MLYVAMLINYTKRQKMSNERKYLTVDDLTVLWKKANNLKNGKKEFTEIYQELLDNGFKYAGWGKGVVTKETITGVSRLTL